MDKQKGEAAKPRRGRPRKQKPQVATASDAHHETPFKKRGRPRKTGVITITHKSFLLRKRARFTAFAETIGMTEGEPQARDFPIERDERCQSMQRKAAQRGVAARREHRSVMLSCVQALSREYAPNDRSAAAKIANRLGVSARYVRSLRRKR